MADTIVNTPAPQSDSSAGWVVAIIILLAVIAGGVYAYRAGMFGSRAAPDTTNINVTIPNPLPSGGGDEAPTQ